METVTGTCGVLETALWKRDVGCRTRFPGILAQGGVQWGSFRKTSQEGPGRGQGRDVRGKAQAQISPGECFGSFLGESIAILAGSEVQVPSSFDLQQIEL